MAEFIRDLPRFHQDCKKFETIIESIAEVDAKKHQELKTLYADFLIKVEAVDRSVEDMASGFVAVGLQHGTFVEELKKVRLRLDKEFKHAEKLLEGRS